MFRKSKKSISTIGEIIDQPMKDFKNTLEKEHVNIGTMNNLIHYLNGAYADLRQRKDSLIKSLENKDLSKKDRNKTVKCIKGIYSELIKVEHKVIYLQDRVNELIHVEDEIDSPKE